MALTFERLVHPNPVDAASRAAILEDPGFGKHFTDHMVTIRWTVEAGWHDAQVSQRRPFQIDPAASVLHYAQEIFEGLKAYRGSDGQIRLFRPLENARRFNRSAERMAMPSLPEEVFLEAVRLLVEMDRDWVTAGDGSLYLRPFMFADDAFLGVRPASSYCFCVIACPAGAYFKGGDGAIRLWVTPDFSRAARGGTGAAKCGGNYAGSLVAQQQAIDNGCDQVLFLDAADGGWVEELGGMNIFFAFDDNRLVTPPLRGTILPGITRASLLTIASDLGIEVSEQPYSFDQWQSDASSGRLREAFACGTAAVVAGIGAVMTPAGQFTIGDGLSGPVTVRLRNELVQVQRGELADTRGWIHRLG